MHNLKYTKKLCILKVYFCSSSIMFLVLLLIFQIILKISKPLFKKNSDLNNSEFVMFYGQRGRSQRMVQGLNYITFEGDTI